jgi:hypothetical protein
VSRLRGSHPKWVIVWLAPAGEFRAYRRMPGARRDTALSAATAGDLAEAIRQADERAPGPRSSRVNSRENR